MDDKHSNQEGLLLLPLSEYVGIDRNDPIRFYKVPMLGYFYQKRVNMCLRRCKGGERILEVGFGSGVTFFNLANIYRQVHGIDLYADTDKIKKMFASKGLDVNLRKGDLLKLPYTDEFFDTILLISILEHLQPQDLIKAFQETQRVLKPGGQMVYGVPVDRVITRLGFFLLGYNIKKHHYSTHKQIREIAQSQFKKVAIEQLRMPILGTAIYEVGECIKW